MPAQATCPTLWQMQGGEEGNYCCTAEQVETIASNVSELRTKDQHLADHLCHVL